MAKGDSEVEQIAAAIAAEGLGWTAAENELTALSPAERQGYLGLLVSPQELASFAAETAQMAAQETAAGVGAGLIGAPSAVDWRNNGGNFVTPIKNQGGCGSCVSFCSCSVIESAVRIKLGNPGFAIDLSEAFMQFCGGGSCNGWGLTSGLSFAQSTGVTDEACMPYQARNMDCGTSRCSDWQNRLTKINSFAGHSTMAARKEAVARGPVLAGMEVWSDFFAYNGTAPYIKASTATRLSPPGYHCISVVGYDDAAACWIIKNSWGTTWGDNGFGRIGYGQTALLIDSSWMFYSVDVQAGPVTQSTKVSQVYASRDAQNAWAHLPGLGWRRIQPGSGDGVTNMLAMLTEAVAKNLTVTVVVDGAALYQAYL
jgi:C1A family cysteine protease